MIIKYIKLHVFDDLKEHNLKKMLDEKLMVMVNSDDPAYFWRLFKQKFD